MKKTVKHNEEKIKVNFEKTNSICDYKKICERSGRTLEANGSYFYVINNKSYKIFWSTKYKNTYSVRLSFEGFTCGDSEKKMIEHIILKYGL